MQVILNTIKKEITFSESITIKNLHRITENLSMGYGVFDDYLISININIKLKLPIKIEIPIQRDYNFTPNYEWLNYKECKPTGLKNIKTEEEPIPNNKETILNKGIYNLNVILP